MIRTRTLATLLLLLAACGTAPDDPGTTPDGGSSNVEPDGGATATKAAKIRFVAALAEATPQRKSFSATLDGASIATGFDEGVLATTGTWFHPGQDVGFVELAPGTHALKVKVVFEFQYCGNDPGCGSPQTINPTFEQTLNFDVAEGDVKVALIHAGTIVPARGAPPQPIGTVEVRASNEERTTGKGLLYLRGIAYPRAPDITVTVRGSGCEAASGGSATVTPFDAGELGLPDGEMYLGLKGDAPGFTWFKLPPRTNNLVLPVFAGVSPLSVPAATSGAGVGLEAATSPVTCE